LLILILDLYTFYTYSMCISPVIFMFESLKFKINVNDHNPPHVHVEGRGASVRINLLTMSYMDDHTDFSQSALERIKREVTRYRDLLLEEWEKYHEKD
jgi:hypothetical protein